MKLIVLASAFLSLVRAGDPAGEEPGRELTLYFFFSENTARAPEAALAISSFLKSHSGRVVLRPALLVQDWSALRNVTEASPLFRTLRPLGVPLRPFDEEALRLAAAWKISQLPSAVLVRDGRAHVAQGASPDLESLFRCSR